MNHPTDRMAHITAFIQDWPPFCSSPVSVPTELSFVLLCLGNIRNEEQKGRTEMKSRNEEQIVTLTNVYVDHLEKIFLKSYYRLGVRK